MRLSLLLLLSAVPLALGADPAPGPKPTTTVKLTADPAKPIPCQPCIIDCDSRSPVLWRVKGEASFKARGQSLFITVPSSEPVTVLAYTVSGDAVVETTLVLTPDKPPAPPVPLPPLPITQAVPPGHTATVQTDPGGKVTVFVAPSP